MSLSDLSIPYSLEWLYGLCFFTIFRIILRSSGNPQCSSFVPRLLDRLSVMDSLADEGVFRSYQTSSDIHMISFCSLEAIVPLEEDRFPPEEIERVPERSGSVKKIPLSYVAMKSRFIDDSRPDSVQFFLSILPPSVRHQYCR